MQIQYEVLANGTWEPDEVSMHQYILTRKCEVKRKCDINGQEK